MRKTGSIVPLLGLCLVGCVAGDGDSTPETTEEAAALAAPAPVAYGFAPCNQLNADPAALAPDEIALCARYQRAFDAAAAAAADDPSGAGWGEVEQMILMTFYTEMNALRAN